MIPTFRRDGKLPAGVHQAEWQEFEQRFGGTPRRLWLMTGLLTAVRLLKLAGCRTVYVDGSFMTAKPDPGDFDACWDITGVDVNLLAQIFFDFANGRAAQKAQFGGELFPAQLSEGGSGRSYLDFFQKDRDGHTKGIIALSLRSVS